MQYNKEFEKNGFTVLKKIISKKLIREIEKDIENVKKKVVKLRQLNFHKTDDGKFNTIHNINKFYKKGKLFGFCPVLSTCSIKNSLGILRCIPAPSPVLPSASTAPL